MFVYFMFCEWIVIVKELIKRVELFFRLRKGGIEGGVKLCSKLKVELKFL